mgnify:CR=1 FL=1
MKLHDLWWVQTGADVLLWTMAICLLLAMTRLLRGPSLPDRVVALDLIATIGVAMMVVYAMAYNVRVIIDAALFLALVSFVGTVAFARYLERRVRP